MTKETLNPRQLHKAISKAHMAETSKKLAILEHADAVKRYAKATPGYKRGHQRSVKKAMTKMLKMEVGHGKA